LGPLPTPEPGGSGGAVSGSSGSGGAVSGSDSPACFATAGTVTPASTVEEFYEAIVGRWLICGDGVALFVGAPVDTIGVEYEAPTTAGAILRGNMYYLINGPDGVVRGEGFDYQLTYDVGPQDPTEGPPLQLNMHPTPTSGIGSAFKYSPSPRQWQLTSLSVSPETRARLVPAD